MADLGDLKQRIIDETNRDDLADDLADAFDRVIADAIAWYSAERWWFNESRVTSTATIASEYIDRPDGARIVDKPYLVVGSVRYPLNKRSREWIENMYGVAQSGQPTDYCEVGDQLRFWPTPNLAYTVIWLNVSDLAALDYDVDTSENAWTNDGAPLIAARARMFFFRDYFKADEDLARATAAEAEWYGRLKGETNRRLGTGRLRASP